MIVKRCPKCLVNYSPHRREPCCKCGGELIDHNETEQEENERLKSNRGPGPSFGIFLTVLKLFFLFFLLPSICVAVYHFLKHVPSGDMSARYFFENFSRYSFEVVIHSYSNCVGLVKKLFN